MSLKGKRIGVLMGGLSSEREISLRSGQAVCAALKDMGLDAVSLEVMCETRGEIRRLIRQAAVNVVFIAMHGGFGEGGGLQHILEEVDIPYTGPCSDSSRAAMDKAFSRKLFKKAKLHVPRCHVISKKARRRTFPLLLRYPLVVKPSAQGSSIGISFVDTPAHLPRALADAFQFGDDVLVEEFIKGREITVSVLDGLALPVVEIIPKKRFFDFQAKYEKGLTEYVVPASLPSGVAERAQRDAVTAYRALSCRHLSRVDIIIGDDGTPYVLEINTIPGMTQTSLSPKAAGAAGMDFGHLCRRLVELALACDHEQKKK